VSFEVEFRNTHGQAASIGSAGPYTLVVDRPADAGGQGLGFNGGQLLYVAIGGCVSNDLFRIITARHDPANPSDRLKRATQDNLTGRRQSPGLVPDHAGTGQGAASHRPEDNENKH